MPTYEMAERFLHQYRRLTQRQQSQFRQARADFVAALLAWEHGGFQGRPQFPQHLRVKQVQGYPNVWELTWAPDGRCTWEYGVALGPDRCHIIWRRIGTHQIFNDP